MQVPRINNTPHTQYVKPTFQANFKVQSYEEFMADEFVKGIGSTIKEKGKQYLLSPEYKAGLEAIERLYKEHIEENYKIFMSHIKPECKDIVNKLLELPTYTKDILPFAVDKKFSELKYLYELAKKTDRFGELRIPGATFHMFAQIPEERLRLLEPLMLSKNDMGMWNYAPSWILRLDENYSDRQIEIMTRLADCKVNGLNLRNIAENPYLNHEKTIEKAKTLTTLYGDKLREIEFFSNRNGDNYLSADLQLPHSESKPDYLNFKRVFAKLDLNAEPKDSVVKEDKINAYIEKMYDALNEKLCVFKLQDLQAVIKNISEIIPEANITEILRTLQKLTQFANYTSLEKIGEALKNSGIERIHPSGGINPYFYYLQKSKKLFDLSEDVYSTGICKFVTKDDLHDKEFLKLLKRAQKSNIQFINLEGWSDGINLFSDDKKLQERAVSVIKRAKKIQQKHPEYTYNDALSHALNNEIVAAMKNYGFEVQTVSLENPATRNVILEQLRPAMPTEGLLKSTVEAISKHFAPHNKKEFQKLCIKIAEYYRENLKIYSKQRIIESLKALDEIINQQLRINGTPRDELYVLLPNSESSKYKSFELISKMYADLFNIPQKNLIRINDIHEINKFPAKSMFLILDDVVGSGASMADFASYKHSAGRITPNSYRILFCPVASTKKGIKYIKEVIKNTGREYQDTIITYYPNITDTNHMVEDFLETGNKKLNQEIFGKRGHDNSGTCITFPYMAPDIDSGISGYILKYFVPNIKCLKTKNTLIPTIERETYFYNIFGTDEAHINTNASKVYNPKSHFKLLKKIAQIFRNNSQ